MTDTQSTGAQIETPNPLELFWERHRRAVLVGIAVLVAGMGIYYAMQYMAQQRVNQTWSNFAVTTGLDSGYADDGSDAATLDTFLNNPEFVQYYYSVAQGYINRTREELVTELGDDIAKVDAGQIASALEEAKGTELEPLLIWISAIHAAHVEDWDTAETHLQRLETGFANHFVCQESSYPPQFREEVPSEDGEEETSKRRPGEEPELVAAEEGSLVSRLRAQIARQKGFRAANPALYEAPTPDASPVVVMTVGTLGEEVRIRFFRDKAPEHVDGFLERVRSGWYDGLKVDQVERKGTQGTGEAAMQFHFGLPLTRDEADRTKWDDARREPSETTLEFEDSGVSHFPGAVSAATEAEGKSSGERIWISANDTARWFDGERVVFGMVDPADLDTLQRICEMSFMDEDMKRAGRGQLLEDVELQFRVEGEEAPK